MVTPTGLGRRVADQVVHGAEAFVSDRTADSATDRGARRRTRTDLSGDHSEVLGEQHSSERVR